MPYSGRNRQCAAFAKFSEPREFRVFQHNRRKTDMPWSRLCEPDPRRSGAITILRQLRRIDIKEASRPNAATRLRPEVLRFLRIVGSGAACWSGKPAAFPRCYRLGELASVANRIDGKPRTQLNHCWPTNSVPVRLVGAGLFPRPVAYFESVHGLV